jgi:predicted dehydrogenase
MSSQIKTVAVVGCGIGRQHIEEGYARNADKFRLLAICDINEQKRNDLADEFDVPRRTGSFEDLLAMDDLDIIDICTPPNLHYEQILAALAAGKHVICEKPLVGSLEQMDAVIAAEKTAKGLLMPIFQYRFGNGVEQAKRIIESGLAGKPYLATAETFWTRGADYYAVPWRGKWASELGGMLMSHAIHLHDVMFCLMGPATALYGRVATRVNPIETEDCVSASLEFANGALGTIAGTLGSRGQISRLRMAWENVTIESGHEPYDLPYRPWRITPANPEIGAKIDALLADWQDVLPGYGTQFSRFYDAMTKGTPLPVTSADARRSLEMVAAFYHSSKTHTDVALPIGPGHPNYQSWVPENYRR